MLGKQLLVAIDFYSMEKILYIFFCVHQKKETHASLEQPERQ